MWKSAFVCVYQLFNRKMQGETLKFCTNMSEAFPGENYNFLLRVFIVVWQEYLVPPLWDAMKIDT